MFVENSGINGENARSPRNSLIHFFRRISFFLIACASNSISTRVEPGAGIHSTNDCFCVLTGRFFLSFIYHLRVCSMCGVRYTLFSCICSFIHFAIFHSVLSFIWPYRDYRNCLLLWCFLSPNFCFIQFFVVVVLVCHISNSE